MKTNLPRNLFHLIAVTVFSAVLTNNLAASTEKIPPGLTGDWSGTAKIIVTWCKQKNLPVSLRVKADGSVTGKIGDATLKNGRLKQNRGWVGRQLKLKTDYIVTGELTGEIVAAEKIKRSSVSMPLNFKGGNYVGGLATSGSKIGGKLNMKLTAADLILKPKASAK